MTRWLRGACGTFSLLLMSACAAPALHRPSLESPIAEVSGGEATDPSYDWHVLLVAPFGTFFKDSPVPLHEVLLFHEATPAVDIESRDCYAGDRDPPRFVGQTPETYLLCFDHDRLTRIEAAVRLKSDAAPLVLSRACVLWSKTSGAALGDEKNVADDSSCEGRDGDAVYSAHIAALPGDAMSVLTITLTNPAPRT